MGVTIHTCHPSTGHVEVGGLEFEVILSYIGCLSQPRLHETVSEKKYRGSHLIWHITKCVQSLGACHFQHRGYTHLTPQNGGAWKQEDQKFKVITGYRLSSRPA